MSLVTIDFHNTLFRCDAWFRLEIELLPSAVLRDPGFRAYVPVTDCAEDAARQEYRLIRKEVMRSGVECDAVTSMHRVIKHLGLRADDEIVENAVKRVMWNTVASARPLDGAVEFVQSLHKQRVPLAIVSSAAYHPFLEWCLEQFELREAFQHIVTSAKCGSYKSDPRIYQHTVELFGATASQAVHIGDSHRFDVISASSIGMRTILLADCSQDDLKPRPDAMIYALGEAGPHLDKLLNQRLFD